jgi:hypothetical protein
VWDVFRFNKQKITDQNQKPLKIGLARDTRHETKWCGVILRNVPMAAKSEEIVLNL